MKITRYKAINDIAYIQIGGSHMILHKTKISDAMMNHGSGFTGALGYALRKADLKNAEKILNTWSSTIIEYIENFIL